MNTGGWHSEELKQRVVELHNQGILSAAGIAAAVHEEFGGEGMISRNAVIGIVHRARANGSEVIQKAPRGNGRERPPRADVVAKTPREKKVKGVPVPPPREPEVVIASDPVALVNAASDQCRFPLWGDDADPAGGFPVCGLVRESDGPYCRGHRQLSHARPGHPWKPGDSRKRKLGEMAAGIILEAAE